MGRDSFGCAVVNGALFAVGGESGNYPFTTSTVERINLTKSGGGVWEPVASMLQVRQGHSTATLGGKIYAAGGMAPNGTCLAAVEVFDPSLNKWAQIPPMMQPRKYLGLAGYGNSVYAIGGVPAGLDANPIAGVEAFDVRSGV